MKQKVALLWALLSVSLMGCSAVQSPKNNYQPKAVEKEAEEPGPEVMGTKALPPTPIDYQEAERVLVEEREKIQALAPKGPAMDTVPSQRVKEGAEDSEAMAGRPQPLHCQERCDIAHQLCLSSETICEISQSWPDDVDFAHTCQWAEEECTSALNLCKRCL